MAKLNLVDNFRKSALALCAAGSLMLGAMPVYASPEDAPSAGEMVTDAIVARPFGLIATVAGTATFIVSLPFSALGGNVSEAADALVVGPAKATFVRCLGCTTSTRYPSSE